MSSARALVRLVRLPSVLTVPGDVLVGAAWDGSADAPGAPLASGVIGSSFVYLSGMALNDWADRAIDAVEHLQFCANKKADWMMPRILLGKALIGLGRKSEAKPWLEQALQLAIAQNHEDPERELRAALAELV